MGVDVCASVCMHAYTCLCVWEYRGDFWDKKAVVFN